MTYDELVEKVAKAINGPFHPVPEGSPLTLNQLRDIRWQQISGAERRLRLAGAQAAISTIRATLQEPTEEMLEECSDAWRFGQVLWPKMLAASPLGEQSE